MAGVMAASCASAVRPTTDVSTSDSSGFVTAMHSVCALKASSGPTSRQTEVACSS